MIKKVKKGFTLIELVVVIAVIAILSAVSVVAYVGITNNAKKSTAETDAAGLHKILIAELTRENFVHSKSEGSDATKKDLKYTFMYESENDKISCKKEASYGASIDSDAQATFEADELRNGLELLVLAAQGYESTQSEKSLYVVASADPGKAASKLTVFRDSNKLKLRHTNGAKDAAYVVNFEVFVEA